jgi:hypothetical protein
MEILVASYAPRPRMLIFGAIDFAAAVARQGSLLGFHVTVCDARSIFATSVRFPDADEVIVDWPHRYLKSQLEAALLDGRTVICVLTHDPRFDVPLLEIALRIPALAYVGAMGSRRTHEDRMERLVQAGLHTEELARLSSPIGLDLGSRTPQETAVSIVNCGAEAANHSLKSPGQFTVPGANPSASPPQDIDVKARLTGCHDQLRILYCQWSSKNAGRPSPHPEPRGSQASPGMDHRA